MAKHLKDAGPKEQGAKEEVRKPKGGDVNIRQPLNGRGRTDGACAHTCCGRALLGQPKKRSERFHNVVPIDHVGVKEW